MRHNHTKKLVVLLLIFTAPTAANNCANSVATYFSSRSQSVNLPRMMSGLVDYVHRFDTEQFYALFNITPGYTRSFREDSIARCLFGNSLQGCDCAQIKVSGSRVSGRGNRDWLADYFGLAPDYQSTVLFKPRIENFFIDFALHLGLDQWVEGMWCTIWTPFVHTRSDLNWSEVCQEPSSLGYDPGYFNGQNGVSNSSLLETVKGFFQGGNMPDLGMGNGTNITFESLDSCRWGDSGCDTIPTDNRLAEIRWTFGWNFYQDTHYHVGLGLTGAIPTGTRPDGQFLFEPVVGNGHHWELGIAWTSQFTFWQSEDEIKRFSWHLNANLTHLFTTCQKRCFDLCGKPMSRYMLAQKLGKPVENLVGNISPGGTQINSQTPSNQFKNAFAPVGNLTCASVDVSVAFQADVVLMLNHTRGPFSFDLGYNLWGHSCEKVSLKETCLPRIAREKNSWALKGDAHVYGFSGDTVTDTERALSGTQSNATIHKGTNNFIGTDVNPATNPTVGINIDGTQVGPTRNPGVDKRFWAQVSDGGDLIRDRTNGQSTPPDPGQTNTSVNPVLIDLCDLNVKGTRTKGLSNSIFAHFSYSWFDNEDWIPFIGLGTQAEFTNNSNCSRTTCCTPRNNCCDSTSCSTNTLSTCDGGCKRCSLSQWYIWMKAGISFE